VTDRAEHQLCGSVSEWLYAAVLSPHRFTGPLQSDDASQNIGSVWIVAANSRSEAQAFGDGEAFYRAGVFESVSVRRVRKGHFHPELADSK
jgi:hypothetical protein